MPLRVCKRKKSFAMLCTALLCPSITINQAPHFFFNSKTKKKKSFFFSSSFLTCAFRGKSKLKKKGRSLWGIAHHNSALKFDAVQCSATGSFFFSIGNQKPKSYETKTLLMTFFSWPLNVTQGSSSGSSANVSVCKIFKPYIHSWSHHLPKGFFLCLCVYFLSRFHSFFYFFFIDLDRRKREIRLIA